MSEELLPVPGHTKESTGQFCSREGQLAPGGRCPDGCDHADHYANDGHPECEDTSGEPRQPYHRWPSNENIDRPAKYDRCLTCGVRRFSDAEPTLANRPCPGHRVSAMPVEGGDICSTCRGRIVVEAGGDYWRHA